MGEKLQTAFVIPAEELVRKRFVIPAEELVRKRFVIPAEAGIQPIYKFCKNGRYMSILQRFICVIPNGIHQGWIPASAGMIEARLYYKAWEVNHES